MKNNGALKALESRLQGNRTEQATRKQEISAASKRLTELQKQEQDLASQIAALKQPDAATGLPTVTEHALLRYVERIVGVDLEECRRRILGAEDPKNAAMFATLGNGTYPIGTSHRVKVSNGAITTVLPND
jgi:hypothetical protein